MAKSVTYDPSWDVVERPLHLNLQLRSVNPAEMASDLIEIANALRDGDLPGRWKADNCPHHLEVERHRTFDEQERQDEHMRRLEEMADAFKRSRR